MKYGFCLCFFFYLNLFFILLCLKSSRREIFQIFSFHQTQKTKQKIKQESNSNHNGRNLSSFCFYELCFIQKYL